jgi:hypothetical protein
MGGMRVVGRAQYEGGRADNTGGNCVEHFKWGTSRG